MPCCRSHGRPRTLLPVGAARSAIQSAEPPPFCYSHIHGPCMESEMQLYCTVWLHSAAKTALDLFQPFASGFRRL